MFKSLEFCSFVLKIWFIVGLIGTKGSWACPACVQLSDYTFDKILNKFPVTMVKFDVAFPYGDKHEAFAAVAKDMVNLDDALAAEVPVKDYGEKDNEELAKRYYSFILITNTAFVFEKNHLLHLF